MRKLDEVSAETKHTQIPGSANGEQQLHSAWHLAHLAQPLSSVAAGT